MRAHTRVSGSTTLAQSDLQRNFKKPVTDARHDGQGSGSPWIGVAVRGRHVMRPLRSNIRSEGKSVREQVIHFHSRAK